MGEKTFIHFDDIIMVSFWPEKNFEKIFEKKIENFNSWRPLWLKIPRYFSAIFDENREKRPFCMAVSQRSFFLE